MCRVCFPSCRKSRRAALICKYSGKKARNARAHLFAEILAYHVSVFVAFLQLVSPRRRRALSAWCCLLALFFLQAPVIGAMVIATGACCTGDHCSIAAHHHTAAKTEEAPMECDQHRKGDTQSGAGTLQACSMSCCQTMEPSAVHTNLFVLSPTPVLVAFAPLPEIVSEPGFSGNTGSFSPLSPPPKSLFSLT